MLRSEAIIMPTWNSVSAIIKKKQTEYSILPVYSKEEEIKPDLECEIKAEVQKAEMYTDA